MNGNGTEPTVPLRSVISPPPPSQSRIVPPYNVSNAALAGALTAFVRPATPAVNSVATKKSNGSLAAARISLPASAVASSSVTRNNTGSSNQERDARTSGSVVGRQRSLSRLDASRSGLSGFSGTVVDSARKDSFTAATIAAARYQKKVLTSDSNASAHPSTVRGSRSRPVLVQSRSIPHSLNKNAMDGSQEQRGPGPDVAPIEPTRSLVKLFEQQSKPSVEKIVNKNVVLSRQPSTSQKSPPPVVAPKPQRTLSLRAVSSELSESRPLPILDRKPRIPGRNGTLQLSEKPLIPAQSGLVDPGDVLRSKSTSARPPTANRNQLIQDRRPIASPSRPELPPARRTKAVPPELRGLTSESDTALVRSGSSLKPPPRIPARETNEIKPQNSGSSQRFNPQRASPAPYQERSRALLTPHITGDSLANAMVGASIAIKTRSPPKDSFSPPPVPPSRRKPKIGDHNHHHLSGLHRSRSLSPQKKQPGKLLTTLRGDDATDARKNKKHHFRNPNAHHEGTRERWREQISEKERKRYESVWAANKGLFLSSAESEKDLVLDLVVRDIWSRSRLPSEKLKRVWDLVTAFEVQEEARSRSLTRDQFVVGLWLIDQVLKGRNLPHSVNESVWTSVKLRGVKVRLEGKGQDGRRLERGEVW